MLDYVFSDDRRAVWDNNRGGDFHTLLKNYASGGCPARRVLRRRRGPAAPAAVHSAGRRDPRRLPRPTPCNPAPPPPPHPQAGDKLGQLVYEALDAATATDTAHQEELAARRVLDKAHIKAGAWRF